MLKKAITGRRQWLAAWAPVLALVVLCGLIATFNHNFLSFGNAVRITQSAMVPLVLAVGATFVILMGSNDLSVEGVVTLSAVILAISLGSTDRYGAALFGLGAMLLAGAAMGFVSGFLHVRLQIPSFMTTLGMWFVGTGVASALLSGRSIRVTDPLIRSLAIERFLGFPVGVWVAVGVLLIAWIIQDFTRFGRYVYALGGGEELAVLSGIPVARVRLQAFTLAGLFYAVGGILSTAQMGMGDARLGQGRLFMTITAVVVGGTSLMGGQGGVFRSLVGVLIVVVLANGMVLMRVPASVQTAVQGLMIIGAVAFSINHKLARYVK